MDMVHCLYKYRSYLRHRVRFICHWLSAGDVQDILQNTAQHLMVAKPKEELNALQQWQYIVTAVKLCTLNYVREKRYQTVADCQEWEKHVDEHTAWAHPSVRVDVQHAIERLGKVDRAIARLMLMRGATGGEVANLLGIRRAEVYRRLNTRILPTLRRALADYKED